MNDSLFLAVDDDTDELLEIVTGCVLFKIFLVGDDLEKVFVEQWSLHHQEEAVVVFTNVIIQIFDDALHI